MPFESPDGEIYLTKEQAEEQRALVEKQKPISKKMYGKFQPPFQDEDGKFYINKTQAYEQQVLNAEQKKIKFEPEKKTAGIPGGVLGQAAFQPPFQGVQTQTIYKGQDATRQAAASPFAGTQATTGPSMLSQEQFIDQEAQKLGFTYDSLMSRKFNSKLSDSRNYEIIHQKDQILSDLNKKYVEQYGKEAMLLTGAANAGEFIVGPVASALRPEVAITQITPAMYALSVAQTALLFGGGAIFKPFGKLITRLSPIGKAAAKAGEANKSMQVIVDIFKKTPTKSPVYEQLASDAQIAIQNAKVADQKFINELGKTTDLTAIELKRVENLSGYKLKNDFKAVNKAQEKLDKAWKKADKYEVYTENKIKALNKVEDARTDLTKAVSKLEDKLQPRASEAKPADEFAGYKMHFREKGEEGFFNSIRMPEPKIIKPLDGGKKGSNLDIELERIGAKPKSAGGGVKTAERPMTKTEGEITEIEFRPYYREVKVPTEKPSFPKIKPTPHILTPVPLTTITNKPKQGEVIKPGEVTKTKPEEVTKTKPEGVTKTGTQPTIITFTVTKPDDYVKPKEDIYTRTIIVPESKIKPEEKIKPIVTNYTKIEEEKPPVQGKPPVRFILKTRESKSGKKQVVIPPGSIAWRQGIFWKFIPPPWKQQKPISLRYPPQGAREGGRTPKETIQKIGDPESAVPRTAIVYLGIATIYIYDYGKRIEYIASGEKSPTTGLRINEGLVRYQPIKKSHRTTKSKAKRSSNKGVMSW